MTRIVISRCLGLDACRYDGKVVQASWLKELAARAELVPVCPEVEIGLGVPRKPINLVSEEEGVRVIQDETGIDLTEEMVSFCQGYLRFIGDLDAFVLKSRSPSCGLNTTKIHDGDSFSLGSGIFAALAEKLFLNAVVVDEVYLETHGVEALLAEVNPN